MITDRQKQLIRESFAVVAPSAETVAALFYERLFQLNPALRSLFKHNMDEQGRKLMQMLAIVVANLDQLELLVPAVQRLGERHAGYGVQPEHYATVGGALIWTLTQGLGEQFTPEVEQAWIAAYTMLAELMQNAVYV